MPLLRILGGGRPAFRSLALQHEAWPVPRHAGETSERQAERRAAGGGV